MKEKITGRSSLFVMAICLVFAVGLVSFSAAPVAQASSSGGTYKNMEKIPGGTNTDSFVKYMEELYQFGIGVAAILAVFMIGVGAFQYIVSSAGNAGKMADGKDIIMSAIFGLILAMMVYLIFFVINPDLLSGTITGSSKQSGYGSGNDPSGGVPNVPVGCNGTVDEAINRAASAQGLDVNILKSIVKCGEGCNPNKSSAGCCGYGQTSASVRKWCGITGSATESCKTVIEDRDKDLNCAANVIKNDFMKRCGTDLRQIASCYNTGKKDNCQNAQNNYCDRVVNCK